MKRILFVCCFFYGSCNNQQGQMAEADAAFTERSVAKTAAPTPAQKPLVKPDITGVWSTGGKEVVTVDITPDSIFYTEHFESHRYKIQGDSIFIEYPGFVFRARLTAQNDTLYMRSEDGLTTFHRFRQ